MATGNNAEPSLLARLDTFFTRKSEPATATAAALPPPHHHADGGDSGAFGRFEDTISSAESTHNGAAAAAAASSDSTVDRALRLAQGLLSRVRSASGAATQQQRLTADAAPRRHADPAAAGGGTPASPEAALHAFLRARHPSGQLLAVAAAAPCGADALRASTLLPQPSSSFLSPLLPPPERPLLHCVATLLEASRAQQHEANFRFAPSVPTAMMPPPPSGRERDASVITSLRHAAAATEEDNDNGELHAGGDAAGGDEFADEAASPPVRVHVALGFADARGDDDAVADSAAAAVNAHDEEDGDDAAAFRVVREDGGQGAEAARQRRLRHRLLDFFARYDPLRTPSDALVAEVLESKIPESRLFAHLQAAYGLSVASVAATAATTAAGAAFGESGIAAATLAATAEGSPSPHGPLGLFSPGDSTAALQNTNGIAVLTSPLVAVGRSRNGSVSRPVPARLPLRVSISGATTHSNDGEAHDGEGFTAPPAAAAAAVAAAATEQRGDGEGEANNGNDAEIVLAAREVRWQALLAALSPQTTFQPDAWNSTKVGATDPRSRLRAPAHERQVFLFHGCDVAIDHAALQCLVLDAAAEGVDAAVTIKPEPHATALVETAAGACRLYFPSTVAAPPCDGSDDAAIAEHLLAFTLARAEHHGQLLGDAFCEFGEPDAFGGGDLGGGELDGSLDLRSIQSPLPLDALVDEEDLAPPRPAEAARE